MGSIHGIIIKLGAEANGMQKALKDVNDRARKTSSELREVEKALKLDPKNVTLLAQKHELLSKQVETAKEKLNELKKVQQLVEEKFKSGEIGEEMYRSFQREVSYAESELKNLKTRLKESGEQVQHFGVSLESVKGGLKKFGEVAKNIGAMAVKAFADMTKQAISFSKSAISVGQEFDSSMSQVAATLGMTTNDIKNNVNGAGDTFDKLREKAKEMGASTNFSASQAADGLNTLAMSGYSAEKSIAMIEDVLHLSAAGSIDMANAAGYISGAMKGFNDNTKDSAYYADLMAKGATLANTSVAQLGEAMSSGAAGAAAYSQTADSMTVALLRLAEQGDVGSAAGTALAAAMKNLYTPSDKAKKALAELGISAYDTNGKARDFNTVVNELNNSLSKYTEEQQNAYKQSIFGQQGLNAYNKMVVTAIDKQNEWTQALANCSGEAANQYATMTDNLQGDIDSWNSALDGFKIELSDKLMPAVREFVQTGTEMLSEITSAFQLNGIEGAADTVAYALNVMIGVIAEKISMVNKVAPKILLALVDAIISNLPILVETALDLILALVDGILKVLPELIPAAVGIIRAIVDNLLAPNTLAMLINSTLDMVMALVDGLMENIDELIDAAFAIIENLIEYLLMPSNLEKIITAAVRLIVSLAEGIVKAIPEAIKSIIQLVWKMSETIQNGDWNNLGWNIVQGVWDGLKKSWGDLTRWFNDAWNGLIDGAKNMLGIHSPSKVFAGIGDYMALGLGEGFTKSMSAVNKDIVNAIPTDFDIEPTINGSAPQKALTDSTSSNNRSIVFMMNIENFYNQNKQDLDEIMEYAGNYFNAQLKRREVVF